MPETDNEYFNFLSGENESRQRAKRRDEERMREDWQSVFFATDQGRRVFGDMLLISDYFGTRFTGNSKQFFLEGLRWFVSQIIQYCDLDNEDGLHRLLALRAQSKKREDANG